MSDLLHICTPVSAQVNLAKHVTAQPSEVREASLCSQCLCNGFSLALPYF